MALVPFGSTKKPSGYHGASGPRSAGRMPENSSDAPLKQQNPSASTMFESKPAPEVDGALRGHDTNYQSEAPEDLG